MTTSPASPRPVRTGRYRYTKWRWRILVGAFDAVGGVARAALARARAGPGRRSSRDASSSSSSTTWATPC